MQAPNELISDAKTISLAKLIDQASETTFQRILVVGCGSGREAAILADHFNSPTVGIDKGGQFDFDPQSASRADLRLMDAEALEFGDASFDLVFSFHALEHIGNPRKAVAEMRRVLRPGGTFCIGTPNRHRLIGYIGSPTSLRDKILWNLSDFRMRLTGRWHNEDGAHAGFSQKELIEICSIIGPSKSFSHLYYSTLYAGRSGLMDALWRSGLWRLVYPCVYVIGRKGGDAQSG